VFSSGSGRRAQTPEVSGVLRVAGRIEMHARASSTATRQRQVLFFLSLVVVGSDYLIRAMQRRVAPSRVRDVFDHY
jgi:hypothetical protein